MNYAVIKKNDIANGPGVRVNLFVSGCRHHCPGCFNAETWSFSGGYPFTETQTQEILDAMAPSYVSGFTFLGGEPLEPENRGEVLALAQKLKALYPEKTIWCYSGYLYEDLLVWAGQKAPSVEDKTPYGQPYLAKAPAGDADTLHALLATLDVLVDGRYIQEEKDLMLRFRGSRNQRLIDVASSLAQGRVVLLTGEDRKTI